jgi:hypothetical protein
MRTSPSKTAREASIDNPNTWFWSKISPKGADNQAGFVHAGKTFPRPFIILPTPGWSLKRGCLPGFGDHAKSGILPSNGFEGAVTSNG